MYVGIKKLGRISNGGGHRKLGRTVGARNNGIRGRGYACLRHAVDDYSRLMCSEIFADERKEAVARLGERARVFCAEVGVRGAAVMAVAGRATDRAHLPKLWGWDEMPVHLPVSVANEWRGRTVLSDVRGGVGVCGHV